MSVPESRHQYVHENHRLERFIFADAATRATGSGLLTPSGVPYTIVSDDVGQICYQTDTGVYYRLTGVGPLMWAVVNSAAFDAAGAAAAAQAASQPLDSNLTTIAAITPVNDDFLQAKSGDWVERTPTQATADLIVAVGDSGSGGTKGLVPAAGAGDAAAGKFLKADMSYAVPPGGGGGLGDHGCRVFHSVNQAVNTGTTLVFDSEYWDTDGYHDLVTNNSRITIPTGLSGKYLFGANIAFAAAVLGERFIYLNVNGTTTWSLVRESPDQTGGAQTAINLNTILSLADGDYVEVLAYQSTGGAINVERQTNWSAEFWCQRMA